MRWRSLLTQREKQAAPRGVCSLPDSVFVSRRLGLVGHHLVIVPLCRHAIPNSVAATAGLDPAMPYSVRRHPNGRSS
jgi:hypothetical protein